MRVIEKLEKWSKFFIAVVGLSFAFILGIVDYLTGPELSFLIFYLVPVSFVTWGIGRWAGIGMCILSAVEWFMDDFQSSESYLHPVIPYWNVSIKLGFFFVYTYVLSALKNSLAHEKELARRDALTGAVNRRFFYETAGVEMNRAKRYRRPMSLIYIDVDNFKEVNDRYGHTVGDLLLKHVGEVMYAHVRDIDVAARLGGDEFVAMLPETDIDEAKEVADRLKAAFANAVGEHDWKATVSMGVITYVSLPPTVDELIKGADDLMYMAKKDGKNRIQYGMRGRKEGVFIFPPSQDV